MRHGKPQAWNVQPHLSAAPDLWRDCVSAIPVWEGSGPIRDVSTGQDLTLAADASRSLSAWGSALSVDSTTTGYAKSTGVPELVSSEFSLLIAFDELSTPNASSALLGGVTTSLGSGWSLKAEQYNSTGVLGLTFNSVADYTSTIATPDGVKTVVVARVLIGDTCHLYTPSKTDSFAIGTPPVGDYLDGLVVGAQDRVGIRAPCAFRAAAVAAWSRDIGDAAALRLVADPFLMFRPAGF